MLRWIFVGSGGIRAGWSIAIFFAIVAIEAGTIYAIVHGMHAHIDRKGEIPPITMLATEASFVIAIAIPTFILSRIEKRSFLSYGYQGPSKLSRLLWGALVGLAAMCALIGAMALFHFIVFDERQLNGATVLVNALIWGIVFLLVGIAEESLTRGYLLFTLSRGLNFFWASVILSVLFGAIHSQNPGESPLGLVAAALVGFVFCFSIWLTGSLYWAIGMHAAWDWTQSYMFGVADSGLRMQEHLLQTHSSGNVWLSGGTTGPEGSVLVLVVLALIALGLYVVWGRRPALRDKGSLFTLNR